MFLMTYIKKIDVSLTTYLELDGKTELIIYNCLIIDLGNYETIATFKTFMTVILG